MADDVSTIEFVTTPILVAPTVGDGAYIFETSLLTCYIPSRSHRTRLENHQFPRALGRVLTPFFSLEKFGCVANTKEHPPVLEEDKAGISLIECSLNQGSECLPRPNPAGDTEVPSANWQFFHYHQKAYYTHGHKERRCSTNEVSTTGTLQLQGVLSKIPFCLSLLQNNGNRSNTFVGHTFTDAILELLLHLGQVPRFCFLASFFVNC